MTQSPFGGAHPAPAGPGRPPGDFGATTISGRTHGSANYASATATAPPAGAAPAVGAANPERNRSMAADRQPSRPRGPRRARLQLRHISPLTVLKFSAVLAVALFFVWLIIVGVLFGVLDTAGVIGRINDTIQTINGSGSKPPITASIVFTVAAIIGGVNTVLFIALSTIGSVIYNLCADLVGGVEITLSER